MRASRTVGASRLHRACLVVGLLLTAIGLACALALPGYAEPGPRATAVSMSAPSGRTVAVDARLSVTGVVSAAGVPAPDAAVRVQIRTPTGWVSVPGTARTDAAGHYRLSEPTYFYGRHIFRVHVDAAVGLVASSSATAVVTVRRPYRALGSARSHTFIGGKQPVARWDPAKAIPFYVNLAGAPQGALPVVRHAFARAEAASGLVFRYGGATRSVPWARGAPDDVRYGIDVAWAARGRVPAFRSGAIGVGGPSYVRGVDVHGGVTLNRSYQHWSAGFRTASGRASLGQTLMHEIGHALGLDHTDDPSQIMYASQRPDPHGRYQAGDLAGLRLLGIDAGPVRTGA